MKVLLEKEIRLLLPAAGAALLLAVLPVWLLSQSAQPTAWPAVYPLCLGALLLALSSFGREFGLKTFSLMLAQPLERRRIWRVKLATLVVALATVVVVWSLCCVVWLRNWKGEPLWPEAVPIGAIVATAIFAGGLWTTLLLRQIAPAFWLTVLIPLGVSVWVEPGSHEGGWFYALLGVYSLAGIVLAWWQFFHAQEVGWTGGTVKWITWRPSAVASAVVRGRQPLIALVRKEGQLHRAGLLAMGAFFLLHAVTAMTRHPSQAGETNALNETVDFIGGLWLLAPIFIGASTVAEERRLGVFDEQRCQPVSVRVQYFIKLLFAVLVGGGLAAVLLWTAEGIGSANGAASGLGEISWFRGLKSPFDGDALLNLLPLFLGLALAGFFASTLTNGLIPAVAATAFVVLGVWFGGLWLFRAFPKWVVGELLPVIFWPTIVGVILWAAWKNFRRPLPGWNLWGRNLLAFAVGLAFCIVSTVTIHNRVWEYLTPLEPAHGAARLPVADGLKIKSLREYRSERLVTVLPDGRAWVNNFRYQGDRVWSFGDYGLEIGGEWAGGIGNRFVDGSNWVDIVNVQQDVVGIRADGTLWVSEKPLPPDDWNQEPARLVQYGEATDWKCVERDAQSTVILLKQDGTLWQWAGAPLARGEKRESWPGLRAFVPTRLGTDSDWARILYSPNNGLFAWKDNGSTWVITREDSRILPSGALTPPHTVVVRSPTLNNVKLKSLARLWGFSAEVRDDGSLWISTQFSAGAKPAQFGSDTNWTLVVGTQGTLAALKADGTIWQWTLERNLAPNTNINWPPNFKLSGPIKLGTHSDWVAVGPADGPWGGGFLTVATDGSLWFWADGRDRKGFFSSPGLIAPSRKPELIGNIFADAR